MSAKSKVLIVDDEEDLATTLAMRLSASGAFEVACAKDGTSGLAMTSSWKPDVLLLDISMPDITGWEVCRRLRQDPLTRALPIILMTAWMQADLKAEALKHQVNSVILKPYDERAIVSLLERQVRGRSSTER